MQIADIITEFGAYYINQGQNASRVVQQLYRSSETESVMTVRPSDDTLYQASESRITELLQPFQKGWTPKGTTSFLPVAIRQFKMKLDFEDYPDELEDTWLGFLAGDGIDRKTWPFVKWLLETHLIPKLKEDFETKAIYKGVYAAPANGVAGAAATAMDGLEKIMNDQTTAGRITPIVMGAVPTDPKLFVDYVEDFVDQIDDRYNSQALTILMNKQFERRYLTGFREKYGLNSDFTGTGYALQDRNQRVKGVDSMQGKNRIWTTPKTNMIKLQKKTANMSTFQIQNVIRLVQIFTDFWGGAGFLIPEAVFRTDQN